jgi:hypothetical protein
MPQDCPDLIVQVFKAKLEELKDRLLKKDILGKVRAHVYVVEFQKRSLLHAHFFANDGQEVQDHMPRAI